MINEKKVYKQNLQAVSKYTNKTRLKISCWSPGKSGHMAVAGGPCAGPCFLLRILALHLPLLGTGEGPGLVQTLGLRFSSIHSNHAADGYQKTLGMLRTQCCHVGEQSPDESFQRHRCLDPSATLRVPVPGPAYCWGS